MTQEQLTALKNVVEYSLTDERLHLEEIIATIYDIDCDNLTNEELYQLSKDKGIKHIFNDLYILSLIK